MSDIVKELDNEFLKAEKENVCNNSILPVFCISNEVKRIDIPIKTTKGIDGE